MNKKLFISLFIVILLALGGFSLLQSKKNALPSDATSEKVDESMMEETRSSEKSLKDLLTLGTPQECTYKSSGEGFESTGTAYIGNGMMRGDFSTKTENQDVTSYTIVKDDTVYVWTEGQAQGFMMTYDPNFKADEYEGEANLNAPDFDQKFSYDCNSWNLDTTKFDVPSEINFASMDKMMEEVTDKMQDSCALCDSLTGDSKTQCLTALKCS